MTRSAPLTRTSYAWAVVSDKGYGFVLATGHPCGIATFPTRKEAREFIDEHGFTPARIQITVKLAKVAK